MSDKIFKITKNLVRAKSIFELAKDRFSLIKIYPREKVYKIVEEYYEVIKEKFAIFAENLFLQTSHEEHFENSYEKMKIRNYSNFS